MGSRNDLFQAQMDVSGWRDEPFWFLCTVRAHVTFLIDKNCCKPCPEPRLAVSPQWSEQHLSAPATYHLLVFSFLARRNCLPLIQLKGAQIKGASMGHLNAQACPTSPSNKTPWSTRLSSTSLLLLQKLSPMQTAHCTFFACSRERHKTTAGLYKGNGVLHK